MFAPIMNVRGGIGIWIIGKIINHQAISLTEKEVKAVCDLLNNLSLLDTFIGTLKNESVSKDDDGKGATDRH